MPIRSLKPCAAPGCNQLIRARYCEQHEHLGKAWASRKGSGRGGSKWRAKRQRVFERDGYLCQRCLRAGVLTSVELHGPKHGVCDHRLALAEGGADDDSNLETICQPCDREKSQQEARRGGGGSKV